MKVELSIKKSDLLKMNFLMLFKFKANYIFFIILTCFAGYGAHETISTNGILIWILNTLFTSITIFFAFFTVGAIINVFLATEEKGYIGSTVYTLGDEFFEEKTRGTETKTKWGSIIGCHQFNNFFFICINGYRLYIVPKREFPSESEFIAFCNKVVEKVDAS